MSAIKDHTHITVRQPLRSRMTSQSTPRAHRRAGFGFTLIEMLVVIGIIALLAGILLVALNAARTSGLRLQTQTRMEAFARACDTFQQDHGFYPGAVPERFLESDPKITTTESAILHLMGGVARQVDYYPNNPAPYDDLATADGWVEVTFTDDGDTFAIKFNRNLIGDGPIIDAEQYSPYFSPGGGEIGVADGTYTNEDPSSPDDADQPVLPDLIDAWGQPIVYMRRERNVGQLVGSSDLGNNLTDSPAQFIYGGIQPYTESSALGEVGLDQDRSILNAFSAGSDNQYATMAQFIRHPAFGEFQGIENALTGTARGAYFLFSAGKDGVYFSVDDGPGSNDAPVEDIVADNQFANPQVLDEYDDIRVFGGD